jgi:hypothetical protein
MRIHSILMVVALTFVGVLATPAAGQWPDTSRQQDHEPNFDWKSLNQVLELLRSDERRLPSPCWRQFDSAGWILFEKAPFDSTTEDSPQPAVQSVNCVRLELFEQARVRYSFLSSSRVMLTRGSCPTYNVD